MKGIIMAGGSGSRLRPLTCDLPKPMVPVMNKPVMTYSIELLKKYGITETGVTLQYLPERIQEHFGDGSDLGVSLNYFIEETPLGTAGSVKNADDFLDEPFIVISGDALTDIDLEKAVGFHRERGAVATLVLKRVEVPLEYGVVVTNEEGSITRFLEKPNWGEVFSDTVNTGIYILEPQVLEYFEKGRKFDFSQDLFPMLLKDGQPMFGYITDEYWCDIGNPQTYLQAHYDMLNGKVGFDFDGAQQGDGIWVGEGSEVHPEAKLEGPCFIGEYSRIGREAHVGPYTVIGNYNEVAQQASIKRSVLWNHNIIGKRAEIRGASICSKVEVQGNVSIFEGSVVGEGNQLHERCIIKPDVKLWPGKSIEHGVTVQSNVIWGTRLSKTLFGREGIKGQINGDITPQVLTRLGASFGAELKPETRVAVSCDQNNSSTMMKYSLISGILSSGVEVFDLGQLATPILRYAVRYFGLDGGVHIFSPPEDQNEIHVHFVDRFGANLTPAVERKIENLFIRDDFQRQPPDKIRRVNTLQDVPVFYRRNLMNGIDLESIQDKSPKVLLSTRSSLMEAILVPTLREMGCRVEAASENFESRMKSGQYDLGCIMDSNGENLRIYDETGSPVNKEMLMVLESVMYLRKAREKEVVVPYTAPNIIEQIAQTMKGTVVRTKSSRQAMMEEIIKREKDHQTASTGMFAVYFDGASVLVRLVELLSTEQKSLSGLIRDIPEFHMKEKAIECPWTAKGRVMRSLIEEETKGKNEVELFEGIKINNEKGWALILPDSDEPVCRIYSQGLSEEYAEELTSFYEDKISQMVSEPKEA